MSRDCPAIHSPENQDRRKSLHRNNLQRLQPANARKKCDPVEQNARRRISIMCNNRPLTQNSLACRSVNYRSKAWKLADLQICQTYTLSRDGYCVIVAGLPLCGLQAVPENRSVRFFLETGPSDGCAVFETPREKHELIK